MTDLRVAGSFDATSQTASKGALQVLQIRQVVNNPLPLLFIPVLELEISLF
jgi:hypothetical protein